MNENCIEWLKGHDTISGTLCSGSRLYNKIMNLSKKYPDQVKIEHINDDNSIFFHIPLKCLKIQMPRVLTDEQKQAAANRFKQNLQRH